MTRARHFDLFIFGNYTRPRRHFITVIQIPNIHQILAPTSNYITLFIFIRKKVKNHPLDHQFI